mgnify:CR=1 FL=1
MKGKLKAKATMKTKRKQTGGADAILSLILLVVLAGLGGAAYYFYTQQTCPCTGGTGAPNTGPSPQD